MLSFAVLKLDGRLLIYPVAIRWFAGIIFTLGRHLGRLEVPFRGLWRVSLGSCWGHFGVMGYRWRVFIKRFVIESQYL